MKSFRTRRIWKVRYGMIDPDICELYLNGMCYYIKYSPKMFAFSDRQKLAPFQNLTFKPLK